MKKFVILFFSCAILQFTYGSDLQSLQSDPNSIQGSMESDVLVNAKSPMARRDPRLFFGTTTTATTTTSLVTYCFSVQGAIAANCRRKKRAINDAPNNEGYIIDGEHLTKEDLSKLVSPSSTTKSAKDTLRRNERSARESKMGQQSVPLSKMEELNQLANVRSSSDIQAEARIEPRFFLFYWYTSTTTTTVTTFSTTKTFSLTLCTPTTNFSYSACG